jgi:hypothetical protein
LGRKRPRRRETPGYRFIWGCAGVQSSPFHWALARNQTDSLGVSGEACESIVGDLTRRLYRLQINFRPPPSLDSEQALQWVNEALGAIVAVLIALELKQVPLGWTH